MCLQVIDRMKILVTGASGLLGRQVYEKLRNCKLFETVGACFQRTGNGELTKLDITNNTQLGQWFRENNVSGIDPFDVLSFPQVGLHLVIEYCAIAVLLDACRTYIATGNYVMHNANFL